MRVAQQPNNTFRNIEVNALHVVTTAATIGTGVGLWIIGKTFFTSPNEPWRMDCCADLKGYPFKATVLTGFGSALCASAFRPGIAPIQRVSRALAGAATIAFALTGPIMNYMTCSNDPTKCIPHKF